MHVYKFFFLTCHIFLYHMQVDSQLTISQPEVIQKSQSNETQIASNRPPSDPQLLHSQPQCLPESNKPLNSEESAPPLQKRQFTAPEDICLLCEKQLIANKIAFNKIIWIDEGKTYHELQRKLSLTLPIIYCTNVQDANKHIQQKLINTMIVNAGFNHETYECILLDAIKNIVILSKSGETYIVEELKEKKEKNTYVQLLKVDQKKVEDAQQIIQKVIKQRFYNKHKIEFFSFIEFSLEKLQKFNQISISLYSIEQPIGNEQLAFRDFIEMFSQLGIGNHYINKLINSKDKLKNPIQVLRLYTEGSMFYRILNQCLKVVQNPLEAAWLRFPYSKIYQAIRQLFKQESHTNFVVFRGTYISKKEFQNFQIGKVYQNLGFLSTSLYLKMAITFANNCILKITVNDPDKKSSGFCRLKDISNHPQQYEILFNRNNLFRLSNKGLYQEDTEMWLVQLQMINELPKELLPSFQKHQKYRKLQQGKVLLLAYPIHSIKYYEHKRKLEMQKEVDNSTTLSDLAYAYQKMGLYDISLKHSKDALEIQHKILGKKHIDTAITISKMAIVYQKKGQYDVALQQYQQCLAIYNQKPEIKYIQITNTICLIANVYIKKGQYDQALQYFNKLLKIFIQELTKIKQQILGEKHIDSSSTISSMTRVFEQHQKTIQYYQQALPFYHDMANNYIRKKQYDKAISCLEKALTIFQSAHKSHKSIVINICNFGNAHFRKRQYMLAYKHCQKIIQTWIWIKESIKFKVENYKPLY